MLLHDDVVADGKPKPGAFSGRFGREEWIEAAISFCSSLSSCIKSIGNQIKQNPCDVLREDVDLASGRVQ
jgi:hypothetical protein